MSSELATSNFFAYARLPRVYEKPSHWEAFKVQYLDLHLEIRRNWENEELKKAIPHQLPHLRKITGEAQSVPVHTHIFLVKTGEKIDLQDSLFQNGFLEQKSVLHDFVTSQYVY